MCERTSMIIRSALSARGGHTLYRGRVPGRIRPLSLSFEGEGSCLTRIDKIISSDLATRDTRSNRRLRREQSHSLPTVSMTDFLQEIIAPTTPSPFVGWIAMLIAIVAFGSFAAPAKSKRVVDANVHPLVYQTYKSFWCFATSWLVLLIPGVKFSFTPFALLSALFWVPGGWMAIASVQYAGLAVSQATWSSVIVSVCFVSGIALFKEPVQSWPLAGAGIAGMIVSIAGMAVFSDPSRAKRRAAKLYAASGQGDGGEAGAASHSGGCGAAAEATAPQQSQAAPHDNPKRVPLLSGSGGGLLSDDGSINQQSPPPPAWAVVLNAVSAAETAAAAATVSNSTATATTTTAASASEGCVCCGGKLSNRGIGMCLAVGCGLWGGSLPTPLKLAERSSPNVPVGFEFVTSFGISVAAVTAAVNAQWAQTLSTGHTPFHS